MRARPVTWSFLSILALVLGSGGTSAPGSPAPLAAPIVAVAPEDGVAGPGGEVVDQPPSPALQLSLGRASGRPGDVVTLPARIRTDLKAKKLSIAINFDESVLRLLEIRRVYPDVAALPADGPFPVDDVSSVSFDNQDTLPGDQAFEGWAHIELTSTGEADALVLPKGEPGIFLELDFGILGDAEPGLAAVRFEDVGPVDVLHQTLFFSNAAIVEDPDGQVGTVPVPIAEGDFDQGQIEIIGEIGFFLRGDADVDCRRDITDAVTTLAYLFLGEAEPLCLDAADSDDSGNLDLGDPIFTLQWLFNGGSDYQEPYEVPGEDPSPDLLDCATGLGGPGACDW